MEINHLANDFEKIYHLAFLHPGPPPPSAVAYSSPRIEFIPLKPVGGKGFFKKTEILFAIPDILKTVSRILQRSDVFQFRAPTGIGVFLIPYLSFFTRKKGWYKYAGSWNQKNKPAGYRLQQLFLKMQKRKITVNGSWPGQSQKYLSFENPCLTGEDRTDGKKLIEKKPFQPPFVFCFVGRMEDAKGVQLILDAFSKMESLDFISKIHFAGPETGKDYEALAKKLKLPAVFHKELNRDDVFKIYKESHFIMLPSASEGFPKVIAEAMNFGCIPIVSSVSSIPQYISEKNGYLMNTLTCAGLLAIVSEIAETGEEVLKSKAKNGYQTVFSFTFERYRKRIQEEILCQ